VSEARNKRVADSTEPADWWDDNHKGERRKNRVLLKSKNVCEGLMTAVSVAVVDQVNPLLGLRLQNAIFGDID
jgi:hypothetical protein